MIPFRLLPAAALAFTLTACSDNTPPPPQFDLLFNVTNKTTSNFSRATIRDAQTGTEYFSGKLECATGQAGCPIYYTGVPIATATDFTFLDERGAVVAAYKMGAAPNTFTALEVSLRTTGYYLIDQLLRSSAALGAVPQSQLEALAYNFTLNYTSPDGATDYHEEMAAHYAYRVRKDGVTVTQFLESLAGRLLNGDIAALEEFTPAAKAASEGASQPISLAADDSCSTAASNALIISGAVAAGVANAFPIAGTVASAAVGLFQSACDDTSTKLDAIDSKLNQLQLSLDGLSDSLGDLRNFTSGAAINTGEDAFQTLSQNLERLASAYRVMKANRQVSSLKEYVQAVGGMEGNALRRALDSEISGGPLNTLMRNFRPAGLTGGAISPLGGDMLVQFEQLLQDGKLNTIISAVKLQCDAPPSGDLIRLRVQCNLFLSTSVSRLVAAHQLANELAGQVYDVLDAYRDSDPATVGQFNYAVDRSAGDYKAALKSNFKAQQDKLVNRYKADIVGNPVSQQTGMYDTFRGLDVSFRTAIGAANCRNDKLDGITALVGWSKQSTEEYLETTCKDFATPILSRYFLKLGGSEVNAKSNICNVLGVLVPCNRTDKSYVWNDGLRTFFAESNPVAIKLTPSLGLVGFFAVNPTLDRDGANRISSRPLPAAGEGLRLVNQPRLVSDDGVADLRGAQPVQHLQWSRDPSGFVHVTWMRYTHTDGASVVFAFTGRSLTRITNMVCVTADCSIGEGIQIGRASRDQMGLVFTRGPKNLTLGKYGAMIASPDFTENRELLGFFVKRDGVYNPVYPK
jgi:hypothetical protein